MKYKVGDKVRIKSREWYKENKIRNSINLGGRYFTQDMSYYCGREAIIEVAESGFTKGYRYFLNIDNWKHSWDDDMFEDSLSDNAEKQHISEQLIKDIAEVIKSHNLGVSVSENEGKLIIEPLKDEEKDDLPIDTPCMVDDINKYAWRLRYYAGNGVVWNNGYKKKDGVVTVKWKYIIPCDKFNFENPEESLKYNIVK